LFNVKSFGLSDRGRVRPANEDCFVIAELARTLYVHETNLPQSNATFSSHRGHVFVVADGVGGNAAGEVASSLSVASIEDFLLNTLRRFSNLQASEEQDVLRELQKALLQADSRIFEETAKHPQWRGMATTITFAFAVNWRLFVAHAGDCRCYLFSKGSLQRLTQDHTLTAELVREGSVSPQDAAKSPFRHVVTNILGGDKPGVKAELHSLELHPDDILLLCSDGLTGMLPEDRIVAILQAEQEPQHACELLVAEANQGGGRDNVTVIVAHMTMAGTD
jgi:PPM family protein phosphatase